MDPPRLPNLHTTTATVAATVNPTTLHLNYPDSVDSSPRSNATDTFNEPLPPVPGAKLRIMCSYGGHIIPRPHDKSLCYVGGETRMIAIDRHSTLTSLCARLSRTLVNGRSFTLKYQLPNEDLDSLVSVTTDEDLDNMIEEYDRITRSSSALAPTRIRLFLFFNKPETAASMGSLLDDAKSENWFVDALNGSGLLQTNLSDSAAMECLVSLDQAYGENGVERDNKEAKNAVLIHDVQTSLPDSPMIENSSSFGSSSTSPSMCNLPPIRLRVEDQKVGIEEQFAQMTFAQAVQKQVDGHGGGLMPASAAPVPPLPISIATATVASMNPLGGSNENLNRMLSDDERTDHGVPVAFRKPPLAPFQAAVPQKTGICYGLPSPDSVASDTSIASASSLTKPAYYHDQQALPPRDTRTPSSPDTKPDGPIPSSQVQIQQVQDSGYAIPEQHQQFFHTNTHFVPHPAAAPMPMTSYYPVYSTTQQQPPMDQHYPVYVMPFSQTQPYMSVQANMAENNGVVAPTRTLTPSASVAYKDSHPSVYPTKATAAYPEMAATVYRTTATTSPASLVQIQPNQFQQPFVVQHAPQSVAVAPTQSIAIAAPVTSNHNYEYANTAHDQVYYTGHPHQAATSFSPQYQTMTPAAAAALADASSQLPSSNSAQQIASSQPL